MGKYLDKFNKKKNKVIDKTVKFRDEAQRIGNKHINKKNPIRQDNISEKDIKYDDFDDDDFGLNNDIDPYDVNIKPAQKPASFHHFLLENRYQDLEKSIRGYKDVYNKQTEKWDVKRKDKHCFTDEESEDIIRHIQSHLSTDIKLTMYNKETFGIRLIAIKNAIKGIFREITEYNFGRFGDIKSQQDMKLQAFKIYVEVITRVEANYLMAIGGIENQRTHDAVRSQESLQSDGTDDYMNRRYT